MTFFCLLQKFNSLLLLTVLGTLVSMHTELQRRWKNLVLEHFGTRLLRWDPLMVNQGFLSSLNSWLGFFPSLPPMLTVREASPCWGRYILTKVQILTTQQLLVWCPWNSTVTVAATTLSLLSSFQTARRQHSNLWSGIICYWLIHRLLLTHHLNNWSFKSPQSATHTNSSSNNHIHTILMISWWSISGCGLSRFFILESWQLCEKLHKLW